MGVVLSVLYSFTVWVVFRIVRASTGVVLSVLYSRLNMGVVVGSVRRGYSARACLAVADEVERGAASRAEGGRWKASSRSPAMFWREARVSLPDAG